MEDNGGLLGFLRTPEGMGLLGTVFGGMAAAKRGQPVNTLGRAGLAGALAYGYGTNRDEKAKQAALVANQASDNMAALRNAFSPVSGGNAMTDGLGPTNANALNIGKPPAAFNPGSFLANNPKANLEGLTQAMALNKSMQPDAVAQKSIDPNKPFTLGPNGEVVANKPYQDYLASLEEMKARNMRPPSQPMSPVAYKDPVTGQVIWGTITEAKGKQAANYSPDIQGQIAAAKASGGETGQATGESVAKLQDMESMMPRLETVTAELSDLGKKATYTMVGQGANFARRQLGMGVGEGAIARKEYISKVDNEILPLLRQTFGAQFTQKEGESLKATLGDTNASPEEKDAVLKSFIETKYGQIAGLKRRTGQGEMAPVKSTASSGAINMLKMNPKLAADYDKKYGAGSAAKVLGR
jgi:hypothetical protein